MDVPSPDHIQATLTYLYTGSLPPTASMPAVLFGLLQNAHYLACDKLIKSCSKYLINKLKDENTAEPFIDHAAFEMSYVSADVVKSSINTYRPYRSLRIVARWLRNQTTSDATIDGILKTAEAVVKQANMDDLTRVTEQQPFPNLLWPIIGPTALKSSAQTSRELTTTQAELLKMNRGLVGCRIQIKRHSGWLTGR